MSRNSCARSWSAAQISQPSLNSGVLANINGVPSPRSERARCSCWKYLKRALEKLEKGSKVGEVKGECEI
jgi:hypothetical protein